MFLNDPEETKVGKAELISYFQTRVADSHILRDAFANEDKAPEFVVDFVLSHLLNEGLYLCSFSNGRDSDDIANGKLAMWNRYGTDGGYAIEFDRAGLNDMLDREYKKYSTVQIMLEDVIYEGGKLLDSERATIDAYLRQLRSGFIRSDGFGNLQALIIYRAALRKSRRHRDEEEMRVCIVPGRDNEMIVPLDSSMVTSVSQMIKPAKKIVYRTKGGAVVPSYPLFGDSALPVRRIIVGPHSNQEGRAIGLESFLKSLGRSDIKVDISELKVRHEF